MDNSIEINDTIVTKDGATLRVLAVRRDGQEIRRLEGIDDNAPSPMRVTVLKDNFLRLIRKSPWKMDNKTGKKVDARTGKPWEEIQEVSK